MNSTALVWFRRDLRLADNRALLRASSEHAKVVPVYIHDPDADGAWAPGAASRWWLHHSLAALDASLRELGSRLLIARGDSAQQLIELANATGARAIYWNRLYDPTLIARDTALKKMLVGCGLEVHSSNCGLLFEPWEILKDDGAPYRVFSAYWKRMQKRWQAQVATPAPADLRSPAHLPRGVSLQSLRLLPQRDWADAWTRYWQPGEPGGRQCLAEFIDGAVGGYQEQRDRPGRDGTSRLSAALHWGEISPRQVALALEASGELPAGQGRLAYLRQIAWREFSVYLLYHHPWLPERPLYQEFERFPWRPATEYAADLAAWQHGQTGVPLVDAGMRQLWQTGWMHNRVRMVVASFLSKNLLIPWQEGARWFWDTLVDADLANNTQGWQWTAGCGADAAPWFRIFNPVLQGQKFDPQGDYVRRWCPELAGRPNRRIHQPLAEDEAGLDYPALLVRLDHSRRRALEAYAEMTAAGSR